MSGNNRRNQGFELQVRVTRNIMARFRDWPSVVITDGRGRVVTRVEDIPLTRDGGVDLIIRVRAELPERVQKALETRILKIFRSEDFG